MGVLFSPRDQLELQAEQIIIRMENFFALNEIPDNDIATKGAEVGLPTVGTLFLGVFVTLLPKLVPRLMVFMTPERKSKFSDPAFLPEGEKMFREKFSENLQMVEDIITTFGDENQLEKSTAEATGFKKFLFSSLEALDIDLTDYIGNLEINSIKQLGRLARGEVRLSPYYDMAADEIITVANILFNLF